MINRHIIISAKIGLMIFLCKPKIVKIKIIGAIRNILFHKIAQIAPIIVVHNIFVFSVELIVIDF